MEEVLEKYRGLTPQSKTLFARAEKVMSGGVSHLQRYYWPYPVYATRAKGSKFWDVDGNEYVDLWMAHYARITGHAPDFIINGLSQKLTDGIHVGIVNEYEVEYAEKLCEIIPCAEKTRFCCSGTEATMYAVRVARGFAASTLQSRTVLSSEPEARSLPSGLKASDQALLVWPGSVAASAQEPTWWRVMA